MKFLTFGTPLNKMKHPRVLIFLLNKFKFTQKIFFEVKKSHKIYYSDMKGPIGDIQTSSKMIYYLKLPKHSQ